MKSSLLTNRKRKRKNKKQYGSSGKGTFNITIKNKDKHQKTKTNPGVWNRFKKCFDLADGTCENPNNKMV
jgi:hypothetical protein